MARRNNIRAKAKSGLGALPKKGIRDRKIGGGFMPQPRPRPMPGGLKPLTPAQKMPPRRKPSKPSNPLQKMPPKRSVPRPGDPLRPKRMSGPKPTGIMTPAKRLQIKKLKEKLKKLMGDAKPTGRPTMRYKLSPAEIRRMDNYRKKKAQRK